VLSVFVLGILSALAMSLVVDTGLTALRSDNYRDSVSAQLAAESGFEFMLKAMDEVRVPETTTQTTFLEDCSAAFGEKLNGTPNLASATVRTDGSQVVIPPISLPNKGGNFTSYVTWLDATHVRLETVGTCGGISRRLRMDFERVVHRSPVFDNGVASKGQLKISGNSKIKGTTDPNDASILAASSTYDNAVIIEGGVVIDGDVYAAGETSYVDITGTPEIAGSTDPGVYSDNLHTATDVPDFPAVDTTVLAGMATSVIDSTTDLTGSDLVFNNVRIAAGTNPTFSTGVTVNGIVYIEAPNIVSFSGQANLNGLVATQDSDEPIETCHISFAGGVTANGVEALPDTEEFADVKQQAGTFIVAPGFSVSFAGNCSIAGGIIAADQLTFTGAAEGSVNGSVISLEDSLTTFGGNVTLYVDHDGAVQQPAGFINSFGLSAIPDSYTERIGG
jgi:hypothetical protein